MNLTLAYITSRYDPRIHWFFDSLSDLMQPDETVNIIIVGRHVVDTGGVVGQVGQGMFCTTTPPKPNVWSGRHRLTGKDYFSPSNARNTAAALCKTDFIAFVDDLSVLGSQWLQAVREAVAGNYIALGAYRKVKKLSYDHGKIDFEDFPDGWDSRWTQFPEGDIHPAPGSAMFGCSVCMPLEWLLKINGWPEALCDSCGGEDYATGIVFQNNGFPMRYDRRMFTFEDDDLHFVDEPMIRWDPGASPHDKSHKALEIAMASNFFANDFGDGWALRELREHVLAGEPFPIRTTPDREWFTSKLLSEL